MVSVKKPGSDGELLSSFRFSGGEIQVKVASIFDGRPYKITAHLISADDVMTLIMAVDAIRRFDRFAGIDLICPYFPYARQDRVMNPGEALGVKVMADIINSLTFDSVEVWDPHSDVTSALIHNIKVVTQPYLVQVIPVKKADTVLVAPDAGAIKKVFDSAKGLGFEMVRADKTRDVRDGKITGTVVYSEHIEKRDFLILDDIADGGASFIALAKELRPKTDGKIYLYVTHGIFSKGLDVFEGLIDTIFVANPFPGVDLSHPLICKLSGLERK